MGSLAKVLLSALLSLGAIVAFPVVFATLSDVMNVTSLKLPYKWGLYAGVLICTVSILTWFIGGRQNRMIGGFIAGASCIMSIFSVVLYNQLNSGFGFAFLGCLCLLWLVLNPFKTEEEPQKKLDGMREQLLKASAPMPRDADAEKNAMQAFRPPRHTD